MATSTIPKKKILKFKKNSIQFQSKELSKLTG